MNAPVETLTPAEALARYKRGDHEGALDKFECIGSINNYKLIRPGWLIQALIATKADWKARIAKSEALFDEGKLSPAEDVYAERAAGQLYFDLEAARDQLVRDEVNSPVHREELERNAQLLFRAVLY